MPRPVSIPDNKIREMYVEYKKGMSIRNIALTYGTTAATFSRRCVSLGLPFRKTGRLSPALPFAFAIERGESVEHLSARTNMPKGEIETICESFDLKPDSPETQERLRNRKAEYKVRNERNRTRRLSVPCDFNATDWRNCFAYWHGCCAYCGKQAEGLWATVHQEHFIPITSADCPGTVRWNMLPACEHCNLSKNNKEPRGWVINKFGKRKGARILKQIDKYFESVKL
jgi:5-methylcytosine-specific restriction endonuclease McrA